MKPRMARQQGPDKRTFVPTGVVEYNDQLLAWIATQQQTKELMKMKSVDGRGHSTGDSASNRIERAKEMNFLMMVWPRHHPRLASPQRPHAFERGSQLNGYFVGKDQVHALE